MRVTPTCSRDASGWRSSTERSTRCWTRSRSFADQLQGFEGAFNQFAAWCDVQSSCRPVGDPRLAVYALVRQAATSPLSTTESGHTRTATGAIVLTGVLSALYTQSHWATLAGALRDAQDVTTRVGCSSLADQYNQRASDGKYSNIFDANNTISCNDSPPGPTDAVIRSTAAEWTTKYPLFGKWLRGGCSPASRGSRPDGPSEADRRNLGRAGAGDRQHH